MERERLTHLLKAPGQVAREDLADLRSLAERYPWFSGAQVLRASGEAMAGDVHSDETLASAAAHIPSRAVLYDLAASRLHDTTAPAPLTVVTKDEERPAILAVEPPLPTVAPTHEVSVETVAEPEPEVAEHLLPDSISPPVPEVEAAQAVIETSTETEVDLKAEVEDPLERQIMEAALASAYDLTLHAPLPPAVQVPEAIGIPDEATPAPTALSEVPDLHYTQTGVTKDHSPELEGVTPDEAVIEPAAVVPVSRNTRKRFSSWLEEESTAAPLVATKSAQAPIAETPTSPAAIEKAPTSAKPLAPEERMSIVDRFIGQEIQTPATKAAFFTPQQAAKRSLDDTAGLVTETLARIYAKQGNTGKAIEAYNKLALKYPEKSAYFAGLSQALEAQQNK